jgi:hypothetical protein
MIQFCHTYSVTEKLVAQMSDHVAQKYFSQEGEKARRKGKGRELEKGGRAKARENGGSEEGRVKIWEARRECGGREGGRK